MIKDRTCWNCKNFWDCDGLPEGVKHCINYIERKPMPKDESIRNDNIDYNKFCKGDNK